MNAHAGAKTRLSTLIDPYKLTDVLKEGQTLKESSLKFGKAYILSQLAYLCPFTHFEPTCSC